MPNHDLDEDFAILITGDQAILKLQVTDNKVHVMSRSSGIIIGSDWDLAEVERIFGIVSGVALVLNRSKKLAPINHYLCLSKGNTLYFFETKDDIVLPEG